MRMRRVTRNEPSRSHGWSDSLADPHVLAHERVVGAVDVARAVLEAEQVARRRRRARTRRCCRSRSASTASTTVPIPIRARSRSAWNATIGSSLHAWIAMSPPTYAGSRFVVRQRRQLLQQRGPLAREPEAAVEQLRAVPDRDREVARREAERFTGVGRRRVLVGGRPGHEVTARHRRGRRRPERQHVPEVVAVGRVRVERREREARLRGRGDAALVRAVERNDLGFGVRRRLRGRRVLRRRARVEPHAERGRGGGRAEPAGEEPAPAHAGGVGSVALVLRSCGIDAPRSRPSTTS